MVVDVIDEGEAMPTVVLKRRPKLCRLVGVILLEILSMSLA